VQFIRIFKSYAATLGLLFFISGGQWVPSVVAAEINSIRLWRAPDNTRLVFDIGGVIEYKVFALEGPHRLVIDIANITNQPSVANLDFKNTPISKIRTAQRSAKRACVSS
jgi:N-acetylmuramoyl-L-alanine amidase